MRILVADDHGIVRSGIKLLLERQPGLELLWFGVDPREASRKGWGCDVVDGRSHLWAACGGVRGTVQPRPDGGRPVRTDAERSEPQM